MGRWSAHYSAEAEHVAAERMEAATTDAMPRVPFIPPTVVPNVTPEATVTKDPSAVKDLMQEFGVCILDISDELQGEVATVVRAIGDSGAGAFSGVGDEQVFAGLCPSARGEASGGQRLRRTERFSAWSP